MYMLGTLSVNILCENLHLKFGLALCPHTYIYNIIYLWEKGNEFISDIRVVSFKMCLNFI